MIAEKRLIQLQRKAAKKYGNGAAVTVSMGLSFFPQDGQTFEIFYRQADIALYRAKKGGRNQSAIFQKAMDG